MTRCRPLLVILLLLLAGVAGAQGVTRVLSKEEAKSFALIGFGTAKIDGGINLVRSYTLEFYNGTREEVESVDLRFWIEERGKTTFQRRGLRIDRFHDYAFARDGSALSDHRTPASYPISVEHPADLWNTASSDHFEIVAVHVYVGAGDLHDLGHMYTWLRNSTDAAIAERLARESALTTASYPGGANSLALACGASTVPTIKAMVAAGAALVPKVRIGDWDIPLLHLAAANDNPGPLAYLREQGAEIDIENNARHTALDVAFASGHLANARWLLAHGADPNHRDEGGNPPAYYAYTLKDFSGIGALAKAGADLKYHNKGLGLMHLAASARFSSPDLLEKLVSLGLSVDDVDPSAGVTPLMLAAMAQDNVAARWLLAHGAKLATRDPKGQDVLDYARMSNMLRTDAFFRREVLDKLPKKV